MEGKETIEQKAFRNFNGKRVLYHIVKKNNTEYYKLVCPQCHKEIDRDDKFCNKCGMRLLYR